MKTPIPQLESLPEIRRAIKFLYNRFDKCIRYGGAIISTENIEKFTGTIYYVTADGNDANNGLSPITPKLTIANAVATAGANDKIIVGPGTYTENVTLAHNGMELFGETGTTMVGTLTITGNSCRVDGMIVSPVGALGIDLDGLYCIITDTFVVGTPTIAFDIDGAYNIIVGCKVTGHTATAFDIASNNICIENCIAHGAEAGTRGYYFSNAAADTCTIKRSISAGNDTSGFEVIAGCTRIVVTDCCSGGGDGERIDLGTRTQWCNFTGILPKEQHEEVYPQAAGEGAAAAAITVDNEAQDETGNQDNQWYWGEPKVLIPVATITEIWSLLGYNIFATTSNKEMQAYIYRINYVRQSAKNGGNAWDENETALTVADGTVFQAGDLVWIYSTYKTNGEIVEVSNVAGNVVTIARETVASGRLGLRWDHTTNAAGTEVMFLIYRASRRGLHPTHFNYSAASGKDFLTTHFSKPREFKANDGLLIRMLNMTDNLACEFDMTILWIEQ